MPVSARKARISESKSEAMPRILSAIEDKSSVPYEGRARVSEIADIPGMNDGAWRRRLSEAIAASGKSQREISLAAGMGAGYVNSLFKENKDPTIENLMKVCAVVGVSLSYVLYGYQISAETEEILQLLEDASPEERVGLLTLLRGLRKAID